MIILLQNLKVTDRCRELGERGSERERQIHRQTDRYTEIDRQTKKEGEVGE